MTRPIKFIAWDAKKKRMFGWNEELCSLCMELKDYPINYELTSPLVWYQFTGLLDKDSKEIYEGHIIQSRLTGIEYVVTWDEPLAKFVGKSDGMTIASANSWGDNAKIIGHIAEGD